MIKQRLNLTVLDRWLPAVCIVAPMLLTLVLFLLTLILLQAGNAFSIQDPTSVQQVFRTIGDLCAALTLFCFTFLIPVGIITGIIMFFWRRVKNQNDAA